jgi:hypothetical protein
MSLAFTVIFAFGKIILSLSPISSLNLYLPALGDL